MSLAAGPPLPPANCSMARLPGLAERPAELRLRTPTAGFGADPLAGAAGAAVPEQSAPAGPPPPGMLRVDCRPPPPSGLPEHYQLQLLRGQVVRFNLSLAPGAPPVWELPWSPEAGATYVAHLFAVNAKGRSEPTVLTGGPLRGPEDPTGASSSSRRLSGRGGDSGRLREEEVVTGRRGVTSINGARTVYHLCASRRECFAGPARPAPPRRVFYMRAQLDTESTAG